MTVVDMKSTNERGRRAKGSFISLYKYKSIFRMNKNMAEWMKEKGYNHATLGIKAGQLFFCFDENHKACGVNHNENHVEFHSKSAANTIRDMLNKGTDETIRMYKNHEVTLHKNGEGTLHFYRFSVGR